MSRAPGGRDRRAVQVTTPIAGAPNRLRADQSLAVTVVGGGLAGMAAAISLAERGAHVTVREAAPVLGGRLSSWPDKLNAAAKGEAVHMERGFHAFFRQYYNARALLRRADPSLGFLMACDDYPLFGPNNAFQSFARLPRTPPLNLATLVRRTPTLTLDGLRKINGDVAAEMLAFDGDDTYARFDSISAKDYLDQVNFPVEARRMLFEVFAHSFFNPEEVMSAGEMLMMFHVYFCGSAEGILFDVLTEPFGDAVWAPMRRHLERLGGTVRLSDPVTTLAEPPAKVGRFAHTTEDYLAYRTGPNGVFAYSPFCAAFNASGQPAASLPLGWSKQGLPIGIHLAAAFGQDETLVALCAEVERAAPWGAKRAPIAG